MLMEYLRVNEEGKVWNVSIVSRCWSTLLGQQGQPIHGCFSRSGHNCRFV